MSAKYIWMAVTADRFETPIAIADTAKELGAISGVSKGTVTSQEHRGSSGKINGYKFVKVADA